MLPEIQKLTLVIVVATQKLKLYLQTHVVILMIALFRPIQTRDDKGADFDSANFFDKRNNSTQKARQGQTNTRKKHSEASFILAAPKGST